MSDQITHLPITALRACPTNPRTSYNETKLRELADSIKAQGVLQPIVARPTSEEMKYEIVFGHRRHVAAALAKVDSVPVIIREMTDDQVAIAQLIENAQREDVTALDEAEGFRRLVDELKVPVKELIKQTGKSKSYIYARLKLVHLVPQVKAAITDGTIDAEVGVLISRLPQGVQAEALNDVTDDVDGKPEGLSYREAKRALKGYLVDLGEAPFDLAADDLSQTAPSCTKCQRRSGNNPDLQADLGDNVCTARTCFEAKSAVFVQRRINAAKEAGQHVIEGDEAKRVQYAPYAAWLNGYRTLDDTVALANGASVKVRELIEQCGTQAPTASLLAHPDSPTKVLEVISFEAINRMRKVAAGQDPDAPEKDDDDDDEPASQGRSSRHADIIASVPEEVRPLVDPDRCNIWTLARQAIVAKVFKAERDGEELRLILHRELDMAGALEPLDELLGWTEELEASENPRRFMAEKIDAMSHFELASAMVAIAIHEMTTVYFSSAEEAEKEGAVRLRLCTRYGVDPATGTDVQASGKPPKKAKKVKPAPELEEPPEDEASPEKDTNTGDLFERPQA